DAAIGEHSLIAVDIADTRVCRGNAFQPLRTLCRGGHEFLAPLRATHFYTPLLLRASIVPDGTPNARTNVARRVNDASRGGALRLHFPSRLTALRVFPHRL